ncbi:hypothetical protein L6452_09071 [Arctium lappa]|uniref:Uncharacterized protein n=1 Tax=Arctium lappa TaxID=4217 RepID=A0ACB9DIZ0_ARCLA|nr:hypothetical protein L6452_09071 [Arctium lappa]
MKVYIPENNFVLAYLSNVAQPLEPMVGSPTYLGPEQELETESEHSGAPLDEIRGKPQGASEERRKEGAFDAEEDISSLRVEEGVRPLVPEVFRISRRDCLAEGKWNDFVAQGLICLDNKVSKHIRFSSSGYDLEDDQLIRTIIEKSSNKDSQGLMGSPSRANIKQALNEGPSGLEGKLDPCVGSKVSELRVALNSNNNHIDSLEKLIHNNSTAISKDISEAKAEIIRAIPAPSAPAPSVTTEDFFTFKDELLKVLTETIAKLPVPVAAPSSLPQPSENTHLVTKLDLQDFSKSMTHKMLTISRQFVAKAGQQTQTVQSLLKQALSSDAEAKLKRKAPETSYSDEAKKKSKFDYYDDHQDDDQPMGSEPERNSTSDEGNESTLLKSPVPVIFLAPSTTSEEASLLLVINVTTETIGALDEDDEMVDYSSSPSSDDAFSSPERPRIIMRDGFGTESEEENIAEKEEYTYQNAQPHQIETSEKEPETAQQLSADKSTVVVDEQVPPEEPVRAEICWIQDHED